MLSMGKSTISMVIFHVFLYVYQRVTRLSQIDAPIVWISFISKHCSCLRFWDASKSNGFWWILGPSRVFRLRPPDPNGGPQRRKAKGCELRLWWQPTVQKLREPAWWKWFLLGGVKDVFSRTNSGWWSPMTSIICNLVGGLEHVLFFHLFGRIILTDFHIVQRGRYTTNQQSDLFRWQGWWWWWWRRWWRWWRWWWRDSRRMPCVTSQA